MAKLVFYPKGQKPPAKLPIYKKAYLGIKRKALASLLVIQSILIVYLLVKGMS